VRTGSRAPGEIVGDERRHDPRLERIREVEDVVREAEPVGDGTRVEKVVERAAAPLPAPREPERDADDVVARGD